MYKFVKIEPKYYQSIKDYRTQMLDNHSSFDGCFILQDYEDIEKWHLYNLLFESYDTCPPGYSIGYIYLYVNEIDEVVGMLNLRPDALNNPYLKQYGGHIGYSIKPSYRNKGIGKQMLKDFLPICKEYKLNKVLLTCLKDNVASKSIIETNGGIFESEVYYAPEKQYLLRYWIELD